MKGTKDYYGGESNIYEVIKIIEHFNLDFREGNALKYLLRAGKKDPSTRLEDLRKGLYYFQRLVDSEAQKDLTVNIKCEDNLSPEIEKAREVLKVWNGSDAKKPISEPEKKQWHDDVSPKLISELKVGDEIKAIDPCYSNGHINTPSLIVGKYYIINYINEERLTITNERDNPDHVFYFSSLHKYFHVSKE